jgi:putative YphP/YqiW family bacilliredoxin
MKREYAMAESNLMVAPIRKDMIRIGFTEMRTPAEVDEIFGSNATILVAVNSACGCSARGFRPAMALALQNEKRPQILTTVFAGQDLEATERAREYFVGYPPSSPSAAILKGGNVVYMMDRGHIEGHSPENIAETLKAAFDEHCD